MCATPNTAASPVANAPWAGTLRGGSVRSRDGTRIHYEVVGQGERTVLLANGLGGRLYAWRPLLDAVWTRYRLVTWDYRGLFESESPPSLRQLSLAHHVDDALAVLDEVGARRAVLVGWSMGVQVSLDLAATAPEHACGLVLINGTYGHVLATGFQPVVSIPWLPRQLHKLLEWLRRHPSAAQTLAQLTRAIEVPTAGLFLLTAGRRSVSLIPFLRQYLGDVLGPSFPRYLFLFQELDAHSVYHLLPEIEAPALVISGLLDPLTPAYQSRHIANRLRRAQHLRLVRAGHFALVERPEVVVPAIEEFLDRRVRW